MINMKELVMENKKALQALLAALHKEPPSVLTEVQTKGAKITVLDNGLFTYFMEGEQVCKGYAAARTLDGREIDTRRAKLVSSEMILGEDAGGSAFSGAFSGKKGVRLLYRQGQLELRQELVVYEDGAATSQVFLHDEKGPANTRYLVPFGTPYPDKEWKELFLSLDQKMLLVPYDNDMWSRYESAVPSCGRKSYDVTAIYDEDSLEGFIIGALNFDVWKNAIKWNSHDARSLVAYCGAADEGTHDCCLHAPVSGEWVASAPSVFFWSRDVRAGMEKYGDLCASLVPARPWKSGKVPFGWNSYSALGLGLRLSHWREAGDFMKEELPNYCDEDGVTYVNLDGAFGLDSKEIKRTIDMLHERGQKAGWYANPCNWFPAGGNMTAGMVAGAGEAVPEKSSDEDAKAFSDEDSKAEGASSENAEKFSEAGDFANWAQMRIGDLFLKDLEGNVMPAADGTVPLDVTHPAWEKMTRATIRRLAALGIDYLKLDFLSHGSVEGAHYQKDYTGRMALNLAYRILSEEIDAAKRDIFVSLSIAPLFPYFLGNARRSCCDTFGHHEDVRYVLNALNFAWWTNGRIYKYNDPDHVPLYLSVIDGRGATTEVEARSRYYASVISGTVMMLSDNYGPEGDAEVIRMSRERTRQFANDPCVNAIARLGKAFVPVEIGDGTTPFYTLNHEGKYYAAIFNFAGERRTLSFAAKRGRLPEKGVFCDIHDDIHGGGEMAYDGLISVELDGYDAVIVEVREK